MWNMDSADRGREHLMNPRDREIRSRLALSLGITLAFVVIEAASGWLANSLALLTDAVHNLTDVLALGLTWLAFGMQSRPSGAKRTYGYHRVSIVVAAVNAGTLVLVSLGVFVEAYRRLLQPPEVQANVVIAVGILAVAVNLITALMIRRHAHGDLNLQAAFLHLMGDVASTAAAVVAGIIIYFTGLNWVDALASAVIGILILFGALRILREALDILLEATPTDIDLPAMLGDMLRVPGVLGVHDLHVWSLTKSLRNLSAHVLIADISMSAGGRIQGDLSTLLARDYRIAHTTLQLECIDCEREDLYCSIDSTERVH
jgi:cobalt-zinc-cadmium efflux system protein